MASISRARPYIRPRRLQLQCHQRRHIFDVVSNPRYPVQAYWSHHMDPYFNLSVEHYLLQKSHPESTILFLYRNWPCVVIGRNQNPWLEVNLGELRSPVTGTDLVRRRSGGGTVFHDGGNVNWSVICPPANFDRDKHAEMVVRALRGLGVDNVRVNERHDIVMDVTEGSEKRTYKVSGSAYKLTRLRALHHGTCLLSSDLKSMSPLLRPPLAAEAYIKARGVQSVRSLIRNIGPAMRKVRGKKEYAFMEAVKEEFERTYGRSAKVRRFDEHLWMHHEERKEWVHPPELRKGYDELKSPEWIYGQTPQFTFSTHPTEADPRERPKLPGRMPPLGFRASFTVRHGKIQDMAMSGLEYAQPVDRASQEQALGSALENIYLHDIEDWWETLNDASPAGLRNTNVAYWLNEVFGRSMT